MERSLLKSVIGRVQHVWSATAFQNLDFTGVIQSLIQMAPLNFQPAFLIPFISTIRFAEANARTLATFIPCATRIQRHSLTIAWRLLLAPIAMSRTLQRINALSRTPEAHLSAYQQAAPIHPANALPGRHPPTSTTSISAPGFRKLVTALFNAIWTRALESFAIPASSAWAANVSRFNSPKNTA
jgi:hypothetical protein